MARPQPQAEAGIAACVTRAAGMGFDHLMAPVEALSPFLAQQCAANGLHLLLFLRLDPLPGGHPLVAAHAGCFMPAHGDGDELPDPRFPARLRTEKRLRGNDAEAEALALAWWRTQFSAWVAAGAGGFCWETAGVLTPAFHRELVAAVHGAHPDVRCLGWTLRAAAAQLDALQGCGFDAVFSSGAWWDYRAQWFGDEYARLSALAPVILFPESPFGPRLTQIERLDHAQAAPVTRRLAYERALEFAARCGDGLLVPMGFEYGYDCPPAWLEMQPGDPCLSVAGNTQARFDLGAIIAGINRQLVAEANGDDTVLSVLSAPDAAIAMLLRTDTTGHGRLLLVNADLERTQQLPARLLLERAAGLSFLPAADTCPTERLHDGDTVLLGPGETRRFAVAPAQVVGKPFPLPAESVPASPFDSPRLAIEAVTPNVDGGRFVLKRIVGGAVDVEADIFSDGHDQVAAAVLWKPADETAWRETAMRPIGNDRWQARVPLERVGRHHYLVTAWRDSWSTYRNELKKKHEAGLDVSLELDEGRLLIEKTLAAARAGRRDSIVAALTALLGSLQATQEQQRRIALLLSDPTANTMKQADVREFSARSAPVLGVDVERKAAGFASWYEIFPRSMSGDEHRHGSFDDVIAHLPAIRAMGFDTLYFPPIHPIGHTHRKGRHNTLQATADDPGSPYAIGAGDGGHDAIHPQLGTLDDFRRLRAAAAAHGLELALDFAIQCSPDHPWLRQHPEWFDWRPDGSIRYAENPPKKYEDIVNVDFYAEGAIPSLWLALRDVVVFWVNEGIRLFRVDNPHTKPLPFWEWLIADVRSRAPDTIFLAEAFTRPKPMYRLAKLGFSQSYTYFTWRNRKHELIEYLNELAWGPPREFFRPHFFVNTPDINPRFLQHSGRPGFLIRAALAATLSGLWGVYSGFELCEAQAVPGKEEYYDSEKYRLKAWDWERPGNIVAEIGMLNRIRRSNPALHSHLGVRFMNSSDDSILYFAKATRNDGGGFGDNVLLVAINLDPHHSHDGDIEVPLWEFGMGDDGAVAVEDLVRNTRFTWRGKTQHVRLDPYELPFSIWRIRPQPS